MTWAGSWRGAIDKHLTKDDQISLLLSSHLSRELDTSVLVIRLSPKLLKVRSFVSTPETRVLE